MKILLDECLSLDFRHSFSSHDAHTVQWAIIVLRSRTNQMEDLLPLVATILQALKVIQTGQTIQVPKPG